MTTQLNQSWALPVFYHFFNNKKWFFCTFYQVNNLFLHQSYLKSPIPSQINLTKKCKKSFLISEKIKKYRNCSALPMLARCCCWAWTRRTRCFTLPAPTSTSTRRTSRTPTSSRRSSGSWITFRYSSAPFPGWVQHVPLLHSFLTASIICWLLMACSVTRPVRLDAHYSERQGLMG